MCSSVQMLTAAVLSHPVLVRFLERIILLLRPIPGGAKIAPLATDQF